eukprot:114136_1
MKLCMNTKRTKLALSDNINHDVREDKNGISVQCRKVNCKKQAGGFQTISGKPPTLCKYHYDLQCATEARRPKRKRDYQAYDQKRKHNPKRIAWQKQYGKFKKPRQKYRKEYTKRTLKWRRNNPEIWKAISDKYYKSIKRRLWTVKNSAKVRNKDMKLTDDEIKEILANNHCFYCDIDFDMIGIDRMDNDKGYEKDNVVPCCKTCNIMKRTLSVDYFIKICKHIASFQGVQEREEYYPECFRDHHGCSFNVYKRRATKKNMAFELTKRLFVEITNGSCYLCDKETTNTHHNGIDRI